jgi:putative membrane protein
VEDHLEEALPEGEAPQVHGKRQQRNSFVKRASQLFSEIDRKLIATAIERAEERTSAEIVPVVASASGRYDRAEDIFGFLMGLGAVSLGWLTCPYMHSEAEWSQGMFLSASGLWPVLASMVAGFVAGSALASYFPIFKLPFIPGKEMDEEVKRAAEAAFMSSKIRKTAGATGVLLYVSLLERRVLVLPDDTIAEKLPGQDWKEICDSLVAGMKRQSPVQALAEAVAGCGDILSEALPRGEDDLDELRNELRLID